MVSLQACLDVRWRTVARVADLVEALLWRGLDESMIYHLSCSRTSIASQASLDTFAEVYRSLDTSNGALKPYRLMLDSLNS